MRGLARYGHAEPFAVSYGSSTTMSVLPVGAYPTSRATEESIDSIRVARSRVQTSSDDG
jgi:hypothetical protein